MRAADEELAREVRALLDDVDRELAARPAPMPPWAQIQGFFRRSQVRRRRRVTVLVATAAAVVAALIVVQNVVLAPDRTGAPARYGNRVRGSLSGDEAWLTDLREWVARTGVSDLGLPVSEGKEPGRDSRVLYASDIGNQRLVEVEGTWTDTHGNAVRYVMQYQGKRGDAPKDLEPSGMQENREPDGELVLVHAPDTSTVFGQPDPSAPDRAFYAVLDQDHEVVLQEPPTIAADGEVTQHSRRIEGEDGVYEGAVDRPGHYAVVIPGLAYRDFVVEAEGGDQPPIDRRPERGGPVAKQATIAGLAELAWRSTRQTPAEGRWKLLAQEPGAIDGQHRHRALIGVLDLPSGARVLVAGHTASPYGSPVSELDVAQIFPAGDDSTLSIAWQTTGSSTSAPSEDEKLTPERVNEGEVSAVAALGPVGTRTVEWTGPDGVTTSAARDDLARTDRTDVVSVRFLGADGAELGRAAVQEATKEPAMGHGDGLTAFGERIYQYVPEVLHGLAGY